MLRCMNKKTEIDRRADRAAYMRKWREKNKGRVNNWTDRDVLRMARELVRTTDA